MKWLVVMALAVSGFGFSEVQAGPVGELQDTVKKIREDDEGVVVLFVKQQGSYYLKREPAKFDSARERLQNSLKTKKPVSVTFESENFNIVDVK